jgi:hypothetical protein
MALIDPNPTAVGSLSTQAYLVRSGLHSNTAALRKIRAG